MNEGITYTLQKNPNWTTLPNDLKCLLQSNNGQNKSEIGVFGKLHNGKIAYSYNYLDFESILKVHKIIIEFKIPEIEDSEIPFAIYETQDKGGFGFSINKNNGSINFISFNEYDYNGGTVHNKGIYKYADNMIEFIENQIMLKQFE